MTESLVSVIIPTYNRLEYVQAAIDSVLQQTYPNYEIIVIDDGSTDGTRDVIPLKYAGRINYYYQENHGRSAARNFGASLARGVYLAFLDSDDAWLPLKLQKQVAKFSTSTASEVAAVCSSVYFIDKFGNLIYKKPIGRLPKLHNYQMQRFFNAPIILAPPSNMLIRKECFDKVGGFDNELSYGEDWDLIIRLRQHWHFLYVDEPLMCYRSRSRFLNDLPRQEQIPKVTDDMLRLYERIGSMNVVSRGPDFLDKFISNIYEKVAYWYFARKAYTTGMSYLLKSGKLQSKNLSMIINNLSYWGAYGTVDSKGTDPIQCELEFISEYVPNIMNLLAKQVVLSKRDCRILFSGFYHNLAWHLFPFVNGKAIQHLCFKAIYNNPIYLFSKQTLKMIVISSFYQQKKKDI